VTLISKIQESGLSALVIGGHAVISYGVPRSTFDLDFLVRKQERERWRHFMQSLGFTIFHETDTFLQWTAPPGEIAVDLMLVDEGTWSKMDAAAQMIHMSSLQIRSASPTHIIALKLHAMKFRHGDDSIKDWLDVLGLIRACKLDPASAELVSLLDRYASDNVRAKYHAHFNIKP
jgi:hypothetical protein